MITEELLGAYLEGNLTDQETAYVERELANDPDLQDLADDVYAYADEPAPYALDLDDIDLPAIEADYEEIIDIDLNDDPAINDWDDADIDDGLDDGFEFIDDACTDL